MNHPSSTPDQSWRRPGLLLPVFLILACAGCDEGDPYLDTVPRAAGSSSSSSSSGGTGSSSGGQAQSLAGSWSGTWHHGTYVCDLEIDGSGAVSGTAPVLGTITGSLQGSGSTYSGTWRITGFGGRQVPVQLILTGNRLEGSMDIEGPETLALERGGALSGSG